MIVKVSDKKLADSVLLIVDVEEQYLKRDVVEFINEADKKDQAIKILNNKMQDMPLAIQSIIEKGEDVYVVHEKQLHKSLSSINYKDLGSWEKNKSWVEKLKETNKKIAICGMWKELCCLEVYTELYKAGVDAYILDDDNLTFSLSIYGSPLPFQMKVSMFGYQLERI